MNALKLPLQEVTIILALLELELHQGRMKHS